jgi:acyl-CoA hydrolase
MWKQRRLEFKLIGWINNPLNIAKNDDIVAINNALMIDLTGQVASESIGAKQYSVQEVRYSLYGEPNSQKMARIFWQ